MNATNHNSLMQEHGSKVPQNHPFYRNEKHSLQGKTGKSHQVC